MGSTAVVQGSPIIKRKKIITYARIRNGGTIVIGGWTGEHSEEYSSGIPVLRNMPYIGKLLFSRNQRTSDRTTLLIFLTGFLVD
jgi:type II secretory pathway component GspD/PulD (secretin)